MARPKTGRPAYVRGRWIARVLLHDKRHAEVVLTRDHKPITGRDAASTAFAKRLAAYYQHEHDEGRWSPEGTAPPATKETTVVQWCERWFEARSYLSRVEERALVVRWLGTFGALPLSEVTPKKAAAWIAVLGTAKGPRTGRPLAPATVHNVVSITARCLRGAIFEELLALDPFANIPKNLRTSARPKDPAARAGYRFTREQLETLLREPGIETRWRVLWHLLALTGGRLGEVIALRWCDIHEAEPLRRVVFARQFRARTREMGPTKTRGVREVPEHPQLRAALEQWYAEGWRADYGRAPKPEDLIVPSRATPGLVSSRNHEPGGALWATAVYGALQGDLEACCLPKHRVHDLRHTFASLCADAGMAAEVASRWTHAPAGTTARHLYVNPSWARQCEEMAKLALALGRLGGKSARSLET